MPGKPASHESLDAIELALALSRAPLRVEQVRAQPLPAGVGRVLRVACEDAATLGEVEAATHAERSALVDAAFFYVESVLLHPGADSYRTLGLTPDATPEQLKEHHRLLIRLMHPDRSRDNWTEAYAQRINRAWNDLRTPEKRAAAARVAAPLEHPAPAAPYERVASVAPAAGGLLPRRRVAYMPQRVLAIAGLIAIGVVAVMWYETRDAALPDEEEGEPLRPAPVAVAPVETKSEPAPAVPEPPAVVPPAPAPAPAPAPMPVASVEPAPVIEPPVAAPAPPPPQKTAPPKATPAASVAALAPSPMPSAPPPPATMPISTIEVESVLERFREAYGRGDIDMLMSMFTTDARNNRGGREAIAQDYRTFFAATSVHTIAFEDLRIFLKGEEGTATARFAASVLKHSAQAPVLVRGTIQFDLRREDGAVSVSRLIHEEG